MDILTKIKSATLMESLIATILIVVIFVVSSMTINNMLLNGFNNNTTEIENRLYQLEYEYQNKKIILPYAESFRDWDIAVTRVNPKEQEHSTIEFSANKKNSSKTITKTRIDEN